MGSGFVKNRCIIRTSNHGRIAVEAYNTVMGDEPETLYPDRSSGKL